MIDRLNARACFAALYQRAAMSLRDSSSLRKSMSLAQQISRSPDARKRDRAQEEQQVLLEDAARPCMPWSQMSKVHSQMFVEHLGGVVDWTNVPTVNTGSRLSGSRLLGEVMSRYPDKLVNQQGLTLKMYSLEQRDRYADLLLGGVYYLSVEINNALEDIRKRYNWSGPVVFVPTVLFIGKIPMKGGKGQMVNADCPALPPLESVLRLRGPAINAQEDWREMLVLWFGTENGIPQSVIDHVLQLDWLAHSMPAGY